MAWRTGDWKRRCHEGLCMSWPTDPAGEFTLDPGAVGSAANALRQQSNQVKTHGQGLAERTQRPVGSGAIGGVVQGFFSSFAKHFAEDVPRLFGDFYTNSAKILEHNAGRIEEIEDETSGKFNSIGNRPGQQSSGGLFDFG